MTYDHINDWNFVAILDTVEENDVPENVKENNGRGKECACDEKDIAATFHSHRSRSDSVSEKINNLEET